MPTRFFAPRLFTGKEFLDNQIVVVESGVVTEITSGHPEHAEHIFKGLVCPGFIDVQVNGGGGVLLNNVPDAQSVVTMANAHSQFGTTAMLPTLITDDLATMEKAADAVAQAIKQDVKQIVGIHFEGPHLSVAKKGIHPDSEIRALNDAEMALFLRQDLGQVLVTVAPENATVEQIQQLSDAGVLVCIGHSNASSEQTFDALQAGATGFTHLFNAMSALSSREPGVVGAALLDDKSYAGLIVDFHHVHGDSCKLAIKCKGAERIMLVTDAMSHVGSEKIAETFAGNQISREGDKLTIEGGRLAGSALDMATAVRNTHKVLGIPLQKVLNMASRTPAEFLRLDSRLGYLHSGARADLVELDYDFQVQQCWVAGKPVYIAQ